MTRPHTPAKSERKEIPHQCFGIARDDEDDTCERCEANSQCFIASELFKERPGEQEIRKDEREKVLKEVIEFLELKGTQPVTGYWFSAAAEVIKSKFTK